MFLQDEEFLRDKNTGALIGGAVCVAAGKRLEPGLSFTEFCQKKNEASQGGDKSDPSLTDASFERARSAIIEEKENNTGDLPTWIPATESGIQKTYGHHVYQKCAVFTESEITTLFKKTPKQLKLNSFQSEHQGPGSSAELFAVSLLGLPDSVKSWCRKMKVFFAAEAVKYDQWLRFSIELMCLLCTFRSHGMK